MRQRLADVFGLVPRGEVDADLCVAMGAAIQGGAIAGAAVSAVLVDVTSYTFGVSALGDLDGEPYPFCFVPIIPKNTAIPVRRSEAFFTATHEQAQVDVKIFQGDDPDALRNIQIGEFRVEGLSKAPAGNPVILDLALDRDGILHVAAREKATGLEARISIDQAVPRYGQAELEQARERIGALFGGTTGGRSERHRRRCHRSRAHRPAGESRGEARCGRRGRPQRDDRPDRGGARRSGQRRRGGVAGRASAPDRSAVLSRDLTAWSAARSAAPR